MSAAGQGYGLQSLAASDDSQRASSPALPLLILVIGLAAAAIWFVALPAFSKPVAHVKPACDVLVLESGTAVCKPPPESRVTPKRTLVRRAEN